MKINSEKIRNTNWAKDIVENFLPINQIDQIKYKYPIELKLIYKGDNIEVERKLKELGVKSFPQYANGNENWYSGHIMNFGGVCGWDITADGEYALCRVGYDDYRLFKVIQKSSIAKKKIAKKNSTNSDEIQEMKKEILELKTSLIEGMKIIQEQGRDLHKIRLILVETSIKIIKSQEI